MEEGNGSLEYNSQPLMEGWGQTPSQPSNFVSILHLRERWLKENEQNQEHKRPELQVQHQHKLQVQVRPTERERKDHQKPADVKPLLQKPRIHATSRSRKFIGFYRAVPVSARSPNVYEMCKNSVHEAEPLLAESDEKMKKSKKDLLQKKPRSNAGELLLAGSSIESEEKKKKSMEKHLMKKKPRSQNEDVREALLAVSPIQSDNKKKQSVKKKPISQKEDVGEHLLAVSPIERNEKKKKPMKKHLMEKKPRSESEDEGEALLFDPPIKSDKKKKKSKRNRRRKKPVSQSTEMDRTPPPPEENLKEEMRATECEVGEQNEKKDVRTSPKVNLKNAMRGKECEVGVQSEKKYVKVRRIDDKGIESQCGYGTGNTNAMKEIETKLSRISVSLENKRGRNYGVYKGSSHVNRNFIDHRDLHRSAARKQRDAGMIWVRKDELPKGA